jgi:acyl carrier protein
MLNQADVSAVIREQIEQLIEESTGETETFTEDDNLYELGFNSLMLARLMVQLETAVGVDPFAEGESLAQVRTVAELIAMYERAVAGAEPALARTAKAGRA